MKTQDIKELLSLAENIAFIQNGLSAIVSDLIFQNSKNKDKLFLIEQIAARQKIKKKLPTFYSNISLCLPKKLNLEQSSSEQVAAWRSQQFSGKKMIDLSGGFGIDFIFHSQKYEQATYVESNQELADIAIYNFLNLNLRFKALISNSNELKLDNDYDLIFLDPDRRSKDVKLIKLEDCSPNLVELQEDLIKRSQLIVSKLSPMISLQSIVRDLNKLQEIWVISERNECKEVLSIQSKKKSNTRIKVRCINLEAEGRIHDYSSLLINEKIQLESADFPLDYIYIPNTSLIKAKISDQYASDLGLLRLGKAQNLYTSQSFFSEFNGRILELTKIESGLSKDLKKSKYNVLSRYPKLKASDIEKKLKLQPSDSDYLIAFPNSKAKLSVLTARLKKVDY